jgi:hypothetical protein
MWWQPSWISDRHVFYADQKSKMAATAGHRLALDPMEKFSNAFFSETTNMIKANRLERKTVTL